MKTPRTPASRTLPDAIPPVAAAEGETGVRRERDFSEQQRSFRHLRVSIAGVVFGTLAFALSLTPSLLPRSFAFQGVLSGLSLSIGYAAGQALSRLWAYLGLPRMAPSLWRRVLPFTVVSAVVVSSAVLARATYWQNSIRARMQLPDVESIRPIAVALVALGVFFAAYGFVWTLRRATRRLVVWLRRRLPHRVAMLLGLIIAGAVLVAIANDVLLAYALRTIDRSYQEVDALTDVEEQPPASALRSGSEGSLVAWNALGKQGRQFVATGPSRDDIAVMHDGTALEPIRVYVGLRAAETPAARAALALRELIRTNAFERELLLLATPTGTGWVDPAALDPLEYMHGGNIATVTAQYSYLPSPVALLSDAPYGAETARALFEAVYGYWTALPRDRRPRLFLFGLSLGALNSDLSFDLFDVLADPFHGVLWAGPPFSSPSWNRITESRVDGTPAWKPQFRDGSIVRFMNQDGGLELGRQPWGPLRMAYLQYASDPVTFISLSALIREPQWLRTPRGPDVAALRWTPVLTFLQLVADVAAGAEAAPLGYGHNYAPAHYIEAWAALTEPAGWTSAHTRELKERFAEYENR